MKNNETKTHFELLYHVRNLINICFIFNLYFLITAPLVSLDLIRTNDENGAPLGALIYLGLPFAICLFFFLVYCKNFSKLFCKTPVQAKILDVTSYYDPGESYASVGITTSKVLLSYIWKNKKRYRIITFRAENLKKNSEIPITINKYFPALIHVDTSKLKEAQYSEKESEELEKRFLEGLSNPEEIRFDSDIYNELKDYKNSSFYKFWKSFLIKFGIILILGIITSLVVAVIS